jgi:hypothetical protein
MNQYITRAFNDYTAEHENFEQLLSWHLCHGFVLCWSDVFAMGYYSDSNNPEQPVERHHADTLFVTYCAGRMRSLLETFDGKFQCVSFRRDFKNSPSVRLWDYKKTLNRTK